MTMRLMVAMALLASLCALPVKQVHAQRYDDAIDCESRNYGYTRCDVPWRDARLVRQLSDTSCIRGRNWGVDRRGIWVDRGCAGRFVPAGGGHHGGPGYGGGWRPGPDWDSRFSVRCASRDYGYTFCSVDVGGRGRAFLDNQISNSACIEGRTWGWNRAGIWVNNGCEGIFTIDRRW